ncbi:MAG TPA: PaaI family thioesterase [Acidimicrobiia bacterium]
MALPAGERDAADVDVDLDTSHTGSDFATAERLRLAAATRDLVDAVVSTRGVDDATLARAADAVSRVVDDLRATDTGPGAFDLERSHREYEHRSPLVGRASPVAPPFTWRTSGDRVQADGAFPTACEGPPGYVHGGWVALAFDEILGLANAVAGHPGMTGRLTVRYRRPTPLRRDVRFTGWVERVDGRRIVTRATLEADGTVTAEAEGLFVQPTAERRREYFGNDAVSTEEPPSRSAEA